MKLSLLSQLCLSVIITVGIVVSVQVGLAQVATSTNFQLQSDSINFGGGFSTSTNFRQESTFGEIGTGQSSSTNYQLRAGYQQMQAVYLSITQPADVTLTPSLGGLTGGTANGAATVTVITDSPAGYSLSIESANAPALQSGSATIPDYNQGVDADYSFVVPSGAAAFGYSPSSVDVVQAFRDNTTQCGVGILDTALACWAGLTTSAVMISQGNDSNHPAGATTTISFRVGVGANAGVLAGLYTATTTLTALPL